MKKTLSILLIEDDQIETMKLHRSVNKLQLPHQIKEAQNGEQALQILENTDHLPDIILLDIHMPKISGIEFLEILKANDKLKYIPAIVLTTSSNIKDIKKCYEIGIAGYIVKPLKYEDYMSKINTLLSYWTINELIEE